MAEDAAQDTIDDLENVRFENLGEAISAIYDQGSFAEQLVEESKYAELRLGVFEITDISATGCTVFEIYYDYEVAPVVFAPSVLALLKEKDTFLISLGKRAGKWHVVYQSRPYESEEWSYEDEHGPDVAEHGPSQMLH